MIMTFNQKQYEVIDVSGRDPLPSFSLNKVALQKNEVTSSGKFTNRTITVRMLIEGNNRDEVNGKLDILNADMFTSIQRKQLIFDDINRYWMATCQKITTIKEHEVFAELSLSFDCFPLSYDVEMTSGNNELFNNGSHEAFPIIEFSLTNDIQQFVCGIDGGISKVSIFDENGLSGQWKIDAEKRKIYRDGVLANGCFDFENSIWSGFVLSPKSTTKLITNPSEISLNTNYRQVWL